jgi:hypothetical protein
MTKVFTMLNGITAIALAREKKAQEAQAIQWQDPALQAKIQIAIKQAQMENTIGIFKWVFIQMRAFAPGAEAFLMHKVPANVRVALSQEIVVAEEALEEANRNAKEAVDKLVLT